MVEIDTKRAEQVLEEMKADRDKKFTQLSGMARLLSDLKLREAVLEGARAYELKKLKRHNKTES